MEKVRLGQLGLSILLSLTREDDKLNPVLTLKVVTDIELDFPSG